jgi:hypothetical protein
VAERMGGTRLAQAMRDLHGDSFILNEADELQAPDPSGVSTGVRGGALYADLGTSDIRARDAEGLRRIGLPSIVRSFSQLDLPNNDHCGGENEGLIWQQALRSTSVTFQGTLHLLAQLHRDEVLRSYATASSWQSSKLAYKLRDQVRRVISPTVCTMFA